jgi:hypothetical protein
MVHSENEQDLVTDWELEMFRESGRQAKRARLAQAQPLDVSGQQEHGAEQSGSESPVEGGAEAERQQESTHETPPAVQGIVRKHERSCQERSGGAWSPAQRRFLLL